MAARGAQILLLGLLAALGIAMLRNWPNLSQAGAPAFAKIASVAVPALLLLLLTQKRASRLYATLIVYVCAVALILRTEWFLALIGV